MEEAVEVEVVAHLHLLEAIAAEGLQPDALQESLEAELDDGGEDGDPGLLHRCEVVHLGVHWRCTRVGGREGAHVNKRPF